MEEFVRAWQTWSTGVRVEDLSLWGADVFYWGRVGKAVEFVAAIVVIAEVLGRERLNDFANRLLDQFCPESGLWRLPSLPSTSAIFWIVSGTLWSLLFTLWRLLGNPILGLAMLEVVLFVAAFTLLLIGWFLTRGPAVHIIKIGGLVVFAAGFSLDLLAS
jgi:hypothetical protein